MGVSPTPAPGLIRAQQEDGTQVGQVATDSDGRFAISLPSGRYQLIGESDRYVAGVVRCESPTIQLVDQPISDVIVACQMK